MRYFFYIITFLLISKDAYSNFELNNNIQNAYSNIISLNFNEAQKFLSQEKEVNPENVPIGSVLFYIFNDGTVEKKIIN